MSTKEEKQSNSGNNSTIKEGSTRSFECKYTEEPQSNFDCSDSGQQYEIIEDTPFAAVRYKETWRIVIGNMIASPHEFESKEAAKDYAEEKPWELFWTMAVWVVKNQEKFNLETEEK